MEKIKFTSYLIHYSNNELEIEIKKSVGNGGNTAYVIDNECFFVFFHSIFPLDYSSFLNRKYDYLSQIEDTFTLFFYNKKERIFEVFSDKVRLQNVFYVISSDELLMSNLIINFNKRISLKYNTTGLLSFLSFGYLVDFNEEVFVGIKRVKENLRFILNDSVSIQYEEVKLSDISYKSVFSIQDIISSLNYALNKVQHPFFGVTSGLDSTALISSLQSSNALCGNFGDEKSKDVIVGKKIARKKSISYSYTELVKRESFIEKAKKIAYFSSGFGTSSYVDMLNFIEKQVPSNYTFVMGEGGECVRDFFTPNVMITDKVLLNYFTPLESLHQIIDFESKSILTDYPYKLLENFESNFEFNTERYYLDFYRRVRLKGNFSNRTSILHSEVDKFSPFLNLKFIEKTYSLDLEYYRESYLHNQIIKTNSIDIFNILNEKYSNSFNECQQWNSRFSSDIGLEIYNYIKKNFNDNLLPFKKEALLRLIESNILKPDRGIFLIFRVLSLIIFVNEYRLTNNYEKKYKLYKLNE